MNIKPRKKHILLKPEGEQSRISESGLITPSNVEQEKKSIGEVLAIGVGIDDLSIGDKVIHNTYAGEIIQFEEKGEQLEYIILHEEDILATINN